MLTLICLSLAAAAQGQYPYPPAAYPSAVKVAQPITQVAQPVAIQSGRLQATHFRSGPYPPAEPVLQASPSSVGPYPPAQPVLLAPASTGPYPAPLSLVEGGEISPVEQDSPRIDHTTYSLPPLSSPEQLRGPIQSYPSQPEQFLSAPSSYPEAPNQLVSQPEKFKSAPFSYPTGYPKSPNQFRTAELSSYPNPSYPPTQKQSYPAYTQPSYPPYPSRTGQPTSPGTPNYPSRPQPFQSGGDVSPDELEIPPNSQIKLQDKRLQYSHGFSDDKGTSVREQGSLLSTNEGWEYVIAKKGSYSYTSPEGKLISVNYIADHNGFRVIP